MAMKTDQSDLRVPEESLALSGRLFGEPPLTPYPEDGLQKRG